MTVGGLIALGVPVRVLEVPREAWISSLNQLTKQHEGSLVSVLVTEVELDVQSAIDNLPLLGISADHSEDDGTIAISVARSSSEHFTHIVQHVSHVFVEHAEDGATTALLVESGHGTKTVVQIRQIDV